MRRLASTRRTALLLSLALCVPAFSKPVLAAPAAALSEADEDKLLQSSIARAKEQIAQSNPAEALKILEQAYDRVPTPALLWPIADLHLRLQQPKEARVAIDKYVAQVPPSKMPKGQQLSDVDRLREELQKTFARLKFTAMAPGAVITVDGETLDEAALQKPFECNPGSHRVEARADGRSVLREVKAQAGQDLLVDLHPPVAQQSTLEPETLPTARKPRPSRAPYYVLGGIGIAGVVVGSIVWGLDGLQSCPQAPMCAHALDSKTTGVGIFSAGLGLGSAALVLGLIDYRNSRTK